MTHGGHALPPLPELSLDVATLENTLEDIRDLDGEIARIMSEPGRTEEDENEVGRLQCERDRLQAQCPEVA